MYEMYPNAWNEDERAVIPSAQQTETPRRRPRVDHDVTPPAAKRAREQTRTDRDAA